MGYNTEAGATVRQAEAATGGKGRKATGNTDTGLKQAVGNRRESGHIVVLKERGDEGASGRRGGGGQVRGGRSRSVKK